MHLLAQQARIKLGRPAAAASRRWRTPSARGPRFGRQGPARNTPNPAPPRPLLPHTPHLVVRRLLLPVVRVVQLVFGIVVAAPAGAAPRAARRQLGGAHVACAHDLKEQQGRGGARVGRGQGERQGRVHGLWLRAQEMQQTKAALRTGERLLRLRPGHSLRLHPLCTCWRHVGRTLFASRHMQQFVHTPFPSPYPTPFPPAPAAWAAPWPPSSWPPPPRCRASAAPSTCAKMQAWLGEDGCLKRGRVCVCVSASLLAYLEHRQTTPALDHQAKPPNTKSANFVNLYSQPAAASSRTYGKATCCAFESKAMSADGADTVWHCLLQCFRR